MKTKIIALVVFAAAFTCNRAVAQEAFSSEPNSYQLSGTETYFGADLSYSAEGAKVTNVYPNSPVDSRLKNGDVITSIGNFPIKSEQNYTDALKTFKPGDEVKVAYTRNGKQKQTRITLDKINVFKQN
jgi:S1-C subfamily serine protease